MLSREDVAALITPLTDAISPDFFYAMAKRENGLRTSGVTHEGNGTDSLGAWQVNADEARRAGVVGDLQDPANNARVIVFLMTSNLQALTAKYGLDVGGILPSDIWYYLAASHNAGLARIESWLNEQGGVVDWSLTKENHPTFVTIAKGYADDIGDAAQPSLLARLDKIDTTLIVLAVLGAALWLATS